MTLEAHDPRVHPVDCPECQRMLDAFETNAMWEHSKSGHPSAQSPRVKEVSR